MLVRSRIAAHAGATVLPFLAACADGDMQHKPIFSTNGLLWLVNRTPN